MTFSIRVASVQYAQIIARTHCASWRTTCRGLIPGHVIAKVADENLRIQGWPTVLTEEAHTQSVWIAFDDTHPCLGFACARVRKNSTNRWSNPCDLFAKRGRGAWHRPRAHGNGVYVPTAQLWLRKCVGRSAPR